MVADAARHDRTHHCHRTLEQLDAALRTLDVDLDAATLTWLNEISLGNKTASEDYAWKRPWTPS